MSELSPLDILGKSFTRRLNGIDPHEVQSFLSEVASSMENALRNRGELKMRVHQLELELADFRERESALHEALVAAQRSAEGTVESARFEAQKIVEEGHTLADRLMDEANQRVKNMEVIISELRTTRRQTRNDLRHLAELIQNLVNEDERVEKETPTTAQLSFLGRSQRRKAEPQG